MNTTKTRQTNPLRTKLANALVARYAKDCPQETTDGVADRLMGCAKGTWGLITKGLVPYALWDATPQGGIYRSDMHETYGVLHKDMLIHPFKHSTLHRAFKCGFAATVAVRTPCGIELKFSIRDLQFKISTKGLNTPLHEWLKDPTALIPLIYTSAHPELASFLKWFSSDQCTPLRVFGAKNSLTLSAK